MLCSVVSQAEEESGQAKSLHTASVALVALGRVMRQNCTGLAWPHGAGCLSPCPSWYLCES